MSRTDHDDELDLTNTDTDVSFCSSFIPPSPIPFSSSGHFETSFRSDDSYSDWRLNGSYQLNDSLHEWSTSSSSIDRFSSTNLTNVSDCETNPLLDSFIDSVHVEDSIGIIPNDDLQVIDQIIATYRSERIKSELPSFGCTPKTPKAIHLDASHNHSKHKRNRQVRTKKSDLSVVRGIISKKKSSPGNRVFPDVLPINMMLNTKQQNGKNVLWFFTLQLLCDPFFRDTISWTGESCKFKILDIERFCAYWAAYNGRSSTVKSSSICRLFRTTSEAGILMPVPSTTHNGRNQEDHYGFCIQPASYLGWAESQLERYIQMHSLSSASSFTSPSISNASLYSNLPYHTITCFPYGNSNGYYNPCTA